MNLEFFFNALTTVWAVGEILIALLTQRARAKARYKIAERRSFSGL